MADLNALIAQGAQFAKPVNPFEQYAQMQQLQANQMKMQEAQAAAEERNALRQLNPASPDYESQLFRVNPQLGIAYRKEAATAAAQKATQAKTEFELKAKQREFGDSMKRNLSANPSNENIIAWGQDAVLQGLYAPEVVQQEVQTLLGMPVEQRSAVLRQAGATAGELKPTVHVGPSGAFTTPAFGGPATPVVGAEGAFQMTPAQIAANKIAAGQLAVSQGQLALAQENAGKPVFNAAAGGFVVPPSKANPAGGFVPAPEIQNTKDQQAAVKALKSAGYDANTGEDNISKLIAKSTSGMAQAGGAATAAFFGHATEGRKAIAALEGTANQIATDLAGGKLGAGISNTDRDFIVSALGDVANPMKTADERLAGWQAAKTRMVNAGLIPPPKGAPATSTPAAAPAFAAPNIDALLNKYKPKQ